MSVSTASSEITVLSSDGNGLSLVYGPVLSSVETIKAQGKDYSLFRYDSHTISVAAGAPMLSKMSVFFAAPGDVVPAVEVTGLSIDERRDILVAPMPVLEDDGYGFSVETFNEDPLLYAMSGYQPDTFWTIGKSSFYEDVTIWELTLRPMIYDAHALTAAVTDSFTITVNFGAASVKGDQSRRLPEHIINRDVFSAEAGASRLLRASDIIFNPFAVGDWYRVKVTTTGLFSISGSELSLSGFPVGLTRSDDIRMYYGGGRTLTENPHEIIPDGFKEIAVRIDDEGDGSFDFGDEIIFYGSSLSRFVAGTGDIRPVYQNHPYSTENVYWITISSGGKPKRILAVGDFPSDTIEARTSYRDFFHIEPENYPDYEEEGIHWYWEEISKSSRSFAFNLPGLVSSEPAIMNVMFLNDYITAGHIIDLYINDGSPRNFSLTSSQETKTTFSVDETLKESNNIIKIVRTNENSSEVVRLDWMEVEYTRSLEQYDDTVEFFIRGDTSPVKLRVSRIKKQAVEIFDTTDPFNVAVIQNEKYDSQANTVTFQTSVPEGTRSRFTVTYPSLHLRVSSITKKNKRSPTLRTIVSGADYIIISHNKFLKEAQKLAAWRARDSKIDPLTSMVVDVDDIYDEFAWGVFDPVSIRDYLKYSWDNFDTQVRYCCLIGDTIWKYKNLDESQKGKIFVPTMFKIDYNGCTATDDFYTWFDSSPIPYLATGRLSAYDSESAGILVDKIIKYEQSPENGIWHNRILFIGDDELNIAGKGSETAFSHDTEVIESGVKGEIILNSLERKKILLVEYPLKNFRKPDATEALIASINDGYLLMNYIGHGNTELISHEHVLEGARDIERLNNGERQSVFYISSCSTSKFTQIMNLSLSEMLHLRNGGGCVAVIGGAQETYNVLNFRLNKEFYINLFDREKNPDFRIGAALKAGKIKHYSDSNSNRYVIMGDPATRLMLPRYTFSIADIDSVYRLQKVDLSGNVINESGSIPYKGILYIKAQGPKIHALYTAQGGNKILYSQPGRTYYDGYITLTEAAFKSSVIVPKDLKPTGRIDSKIYFFATGDTEEGTGCIEKISVGSLYPDASEDITGPEIKLAFNGKSFEDGDYIRRQPTLTATISDDSGVNIYGNRGHNITLMIDDAEIVVLTDKLQYRNGYTTGSLEYTLPILSTGEHIFEISAYDSFNNISKKRVSATVTGSETGDVTIESLLNYPNPMKSDGTTFAFNLNDDAGKAVIKIYSQSGRLVDTLSLSASYGYNTVYWKPSFTLANGVYFYKLILWSFNGRSSSKIEKLVVMR